MIVRTPPCGSESLASGASEMSECSESVYIKTVRRDDGVAWLRKNGLAGYVLKPHGDWVQVFPDWRKGTEEHYLGRTSGVVVHYCFDAEQCWSFAVHRDGERMAEFECHWEAGEPAKDSVDVEQISALLEVPSADLEPLLDTDGKDGWECLMDDAAEFAEVVGLPNSAWASFEYVDMDAELTGMDELYVGVEEDDEKEEQTSSVAPSPEPAPKPVRRPGSEAPWQAVYDLASHFLKNLHDDELIELTLDSRLVRDRLVERLTKTVIENPVHSDDQVVHHWLDNLMDAPEIVDIFATDEMLADALRRAKDHLQAS